MKVRELVEADVPDLLDLYRELHPADPQLSPAEIAARLGVIREQSGLQLFVLEFEGRVAASAYLNIIPNLTRGGRPYAVIENVVTRRALQGRGLGRQLMAEVLDAAWRAGCYKAMLMTGSREEKTHAFYRACGFAPDDKQAYLARPPTD